MVSFVLCFLACAHDLMTLMTVSVHLENAGHINTQECLLFILDMSVCSGDEALHCVSASSYSCSWCTHHHIVHPLGNFTVLCYHSYILSGINGLWYRSPKWVLFPFQLVGNVLEAIRRFFFPLICSILFLYCLQHLCFRKELSVVCLLEWCLTQSILGYIYMTVLWLVLVMSWVSIQVCEKIQNFK